MTKKEHLKELLLIVLSFIMGSLITILILKYNLIDIGSHTIIKDGTQIYEKTSLAPSVDKIKDAVLEILCLENKEAKSNGTGFVYKMDEKYAYVLTNEHVIDEEGELVLINSKDEEISGTVLGKDKYLDLAVIRIDKKYTNLVATIGSSEKMNIGDTVFTVGSPLGELYRGSVTAGVLSGKDRLVSTSLSDNNNADWVMKVLQVDASINPGNSGGPLLNINGEVVGICSLKLVKDNIEGMGFAIPIEFAMSHINELEKGITISWPSLGISMINVEDRVGLINNELTIPDNVKEGVVIKKVNPKTAAEKANLQVGDIITKINGEKVKNIAYLRYELYKHKVGESILISLIRNGKEKNIKVVLDSKEKE